MISNEMTSLINAQINRELFSSYFYLNLSARAEASNLKGTAAWFMAKHHEEMAHAHKMYRYLIDQDASVELTQVEAPPSDVEGAVNMFEITLEHERVVTSAINDIVDHALSEKDHATNVFFQWFVTEQIEEEATVKDIIGRLRVFGDQGQALLLIDNELGNLAKQMTQTAATGAHAAP
jgi:ferritin